MKSPSMRGMKYGGMKHRLPSPDNAGPVTPLGSAPKSGAVLKNLGHQTAPINKIISDRGPFKIKG